MSQEDRLTELFALQAELNKRTGFDPDSKLVVSFAWRV